MAQHEIDMNAYVITIRAQRDNALENVAQLAGALATVEAKLKFATEALEKIAEARKENAAPVPTAASGRLRDDPSS